MTSVDELYRRYLSNPSVCTDTRLLKRGDIFFALKGPSFNGNHFATRAIETGAAYVIVDEEEYVKDERHLLVEDVLTSLQDLARMHRRSLNIPVLAITGSNGKTTTKELVQRVLSAKFRTCATKGNLNNHIGVPLTILSLGPDAEMAVIEMGANHLNEIKQYCSIALPDYGLITNVGKAHLEGFGGFEGVKKGKGELYDWIAKNGKLIFLNADNPHLVSMASDRQVKSFSYGTIADAGIKGELLNSQPFLDIEWRMGNTRKVLQTQLSGEYNFENILAAICVGTFFGVDPAGIERAIASYVPDNSRSQVIHKSGNMILLDAYNANPTSMEAALKNFNALAQPHKLVFLGDMAELGTESQAEHRRILEIIRAGNYELVVLVGPEFGSAMKESDGVHFADAETAAAWVQTKNFRNKTILIKGSRAARMEIILEALK